MCFEDEQSPIINALTGTHSLCFYCFSFRLFLCADCLSGALLFYFTPLLLSDLEPYNRGLISSCLSSSSHSCQL